MDMLSFLHYNTELISVIWTVMRWTLASCTLMLHFTFALKKDFIEIWISFGLIKYS